ncbi:probable RNA-directed DNA polymerase from transposon X-element [Trichonephila clavipes]|nr:probable RNA-directed DNA polymerase from transposon X-element [Trichonephila clavipes]
MLPLQGKHPANYIGCPNNPLNRPPPPPKVNFWQERARKKKELLEAAKAKSKPEAQPVVSTPTQTKPTTSSQQPQVPSSSPEDNQQAHMPSSSPGNSSKSRAIPAKPYNDPEGTTPSFIETFAQINDPEKTQKITICCIYRPPKSPPQALVPDLLRILRNRTKCFIVGDFNARHITWSPHSKNNKCGTLLKKFIRNCGFLLSYSSQPSTVPTRANVRPATIDFGISCGLDDILVETHSELSSDHNPVQFIIPTTNNRLYAQKCTTFSLTNWNLFQEILHSTIPGNPKISNANEIDEKIAQFTFNIHSATNQSSKVKVIKHNITFIPRSLRTKIAEKNRLRKQWQATRFPSPIKQEVNRLQRQIRRDLINLKKQEWDDILSDANSYPDDIHKIIRKKKNSQIHYPPLLGYRGLVYDTLDKANLFAETLEETFAENPEPYDDDHIEDVERQVRRFFRTISFQPPPLTSPGEVCEIILDPENKKSPGADQIKNVALKSLPINAITYLTKIFNRCLVNGYFPPAWKHAIITLLPKPGKDAKFATNYRPINLLSRIGKIFEKIILKRLQEHTDSHNLIPDFQHGFRSETSTNQQLLRLTNRVINGFNSGDTTGGAFLDVEKAFDRVWHDGLIFKR